MRNVIFIAPPAAGKGTISNYLIKKNNYKYISTGEILRKEIRNKSELGFRVSNVLNRGELVNDDIIIDLVKKNIVNINRQSFILDGFPRTLNQAKKLDKIFEEMNIKNNIVIYLNVDVNSAFRRIKGRLVCPSCGRSYNLDNKVLSPIIDNMCDDCNNSLIKRDDDKEETFKIRFKNFLDNINPILEYYKGQNKLLEIDGTRNLDKILEEILEEVKND